MARHFPPRLSPPPGSQRVADVSCVSRSSRLVALARALQRTNLDQLEEVISLQAEFMDLRGDTTGAVEGIVIESRVEKGRGYEANRQFLAGGGCGACGGTLMAPFPSAVSACRNALSNIATVLVQRGTLAIGSVLVAGKTWARVRTLGAAGGAGATLDKAGPSVPVEVVGWRELPAAGSEVLEAENEVGRHANRGCPLRPDDSVNLSGLWLCLGLPVPIAPLAPSRT